MTDHTPCSVDHRHPNLALRSIAARMTPLRGAFVGLTRPSRRADIVPMALPRLEGPFTVDQYQRLGERGVLGEDDRVELIAGRVVEMTPIGDRHAGCVRRLNRLCARTLVDLAITDVQNPIVLGRHDAPQPDLVLLKPRAADVLLIVEIADTSVAYDRDVKLPLYARAGIPEVWLVDLPADRIEVYREPTAGTYTDTHVVSRGDTVTALPFPNVTLSADDILG